MTNAKCRDACRTAGYIYAGTEYAGECYCDNQIRGSGGPAPDGNVGCNMPCNGNQTEMCGGPNRLTLFKFYSGADSTAVETMVIPSSKTSSKASSSAVPAATGMYCQCTQ
jgi:hypothetical protein